MYDDLIEQDHKSEKSRAKGEVKGLRTGLITVAETRFPSMSDVVRKKAKRLDKPDQLILVLKYMVSAPDESTARLLLDLLIP